MPIDRQFTLAPGEAAVIEDTGLRVHFVQVAGDSRCPADAVCVWAGDATVVLRVVGGGDVGQYDLHTIDVPRATATHRDVRISLLELQPSPFSGWPIEPSDYRATLEVTR